jgi:hypothetical protein
MSYDVKCGDLAEYFLSDHKNIDTADSRESLAQTIQDAIENWFSSPLSEEMKNERA